MDRTGIPGQRLQQHGLQRRRKGLAGGQRLRRKALRDEGDQQSESGARTQCAAHGSNGWPGRVANHLLTAAPRGPEVGDFAPSGVLGDIQPSGKSIEQCIRTPKKKGELVILEFFTPKCEDCVANLEPLDQLAADTSNTATTRSLRANSLGIARVVDGDTLNSRPGTYNICLSVPLCGMCILW